MIFRLGIILGLVFNTLLLKFFYTVFFEFFLIGNVLYVFKILAKIPEHL